MVWRTLEVPEAYGQPSGPNLLTEIKVKCLDCLLGGLLSGEAVPFVMSGRARLFGLFQVTERLTSSSVSWWGRRSGRREGQRVEEAS